MSLIPSALNNTNNQVQFIRSFKLLVFGTPFSKNGETGLDLSNLRVKFNIKKSDTMTPNVADIRVYNVSSEIALAMLTNLSPITNPTTFIQKNVGRVILEAGYNALHGVIFAGNIKQIIIGRESATDTFVDIIAGDGERAYNYSVMNTTIAAGANQTDQLNAIVQQTTSKGVTLGYNGNSQSTKLPRGKVMFGNAKNYLRTVSQNTNQTWSIQDEQINLVPTTSYKKGSRVLLTSKTGLIGTPEQTTVGINVKCLINPNIKVGGLIDIDQAIVNEYKINQAQPGSVANIAPPLTQDGVYYVLIVEYSGDNRGIEWYSTIVGIATDPSNNFLNTVSTSYAF